MAKQEFLDAGETVNGEIHFGLPIKRGGLWGWFETTANTCTSRFISRGTGRTKGEATALRNQAIAKARSS